MTFATLQELAAHHGKQAEMYLAWSKLAAEADDAEGTQHHHTLHTMHDGWAKEIGAFSDAIATAFPALKPTDNTPGDCAIIS
jgi:hypothetical protein